MSRAVGTLGPAVAEFSEGCLLIPEGVHQGEPFRFEPWQREITDIVYETDERDMPMWKTSVIGIPRGNGKSPLCGAYADHALVTGTGSPRVFCAAASRPQAGLVHQYANNEARGGPLDDFLVFPRVGEALGPIKCPSNGGILRVLSADGDLQQGLTPYFISEDEPHTFHTSKQIGLHSALATALHKREDSRMVMITTAGPSKDSLLGELVDAIVEQGEVEYRRNGCLMIARDYDAKRLLIWYGAPEDADVSDPAIWRACNPASWITDESLRIAAASNPESEFRRFVLNQWVQGEQAAVQPAAWDACQDDSLGGLEPDSEIWVGVDLGEKRDNSAVTWVSPLPDGRVRTGAAIFEARHVSGMETTLPQVEAELRRLAGSYHLRRVNYDPWQMRDLAARLASEGMPVFEFKQDNTHMVPASQATFDLIATQSITHDGDKAFRAHVLGTGGETTATGGWRFVKAKNRAGNRDLSKNNDACIALAMAVAAYKDQQSTAAEAWVTRW